MRVDDHALLLDGGLVEYQVEPGTGCVQVKDYRDPSMRYQNRAAGERAFERQRLALRLSLVGSSRLMLRSGESNVGVVGPVALVRSSPECSSRLRRAWDRSAVSVSRQEGRTSRDETHRQATTQAR
jgi:hypothetical protein